MYLNYVYAYGCGFMHTRMCTHTNMCMCVHTCIHTYVHGGQDSVVSIATRYGLEGLGIESWWGAKYSAPVQTNPGAHPASYTMGTRSPSRR